jgi:hypothetical protein
MGDQLHRPTLLLECTKIDLDRKPYSTNIPSPNSSNSSSTSSNLGAILGGTFGGLFVITLAALIFVYLKRKEDKIKYGYPAEQQQPRSAGVTPRNGVMSLNNVEKETAGRGIETVAMLLSNDSETARNPQKGAFKPQSSVLRDPQDESGLGYRSPLMGGGEIATEFSPHNQSQMLQQQYQTYPQPPPSGLTQYNILPKDMQTTPAPPVSLIPMSVYMPNTSYSAPAATGVIAPPAFAPYQQTFGFSTEITPNDVYRAHHIGSGTATPESSTFAGSTLPPASFSPPPPTFNNSFSTPVVALPPTSLATSGLQQISAPVSTAAYLPSSVYSVSSQTYSTASAANSSPSASHHSYSYNSGSVAPSGVALSREFYAPSSSMSTTTASPSLASSPAATTTTTTTVVAAAAAAAAAAQPPLALHHDNFDNGITSTVAVRVPDSVPEDQYLAYVLAQQQHEQSLISAATTTTTNTPMPESPPSLASLPRRPNLQA